mgnify:CR=1 FL=1
MIFGAILAGGTGSRMSNHKIPKQFIDLCGKPIIIHTIEKMLSVKEFEYIIIAIHPDYFEYLDNLFNTFKINTNRIVTVSGGKERIDSIQNVIDGILKISKNPDDIIVMHDAVRPFVSKRILKDSIKTASEYGACVATVPAVDTMYVLDETGYIAHFPNRKTLFNGQAPDSFKMGILVNSINSLTEDERKTITGTVQICSAKGHKIKTIKGDYKNIKITTENDLAIAEGILKEEINESLCLNSKK